MSAERFFEFCEKLRESDLAPAAPLLLDEGGILFVGWSLYADECLRGDNDNGERR